MRTEKAPTLSDVARDSRVSESTVSVVLNGARSNTRVSAETRRRIEESAALLRYQPNASARSLVRQRTGTLGILFGVIESRTALADNYGSGILQGIVSQAASQHYEVHLYTEPWQDASRSAGRYRDQRTDGVLLVAPLTDSDMLSGLAAAQIPLVAISPDAPEAARLDVPFTDIDNAVGIQMAVRHLTELGHTRIAHLTGDQNVYSVRSRREAFLEALSGAGLPASPEYLIYGMYSGKRAGQDLRHLLSLPHPPTAIVAGNDNIALALLRGAQEMGISLPGDLSVIGFDDVPAAAYVTPGLTTIRQPLSAIGAMAVTLLIERIASRKHSTDCSEGCLLTPELIVRGSTAPPNLP